MEQKNPGQKPKQAPHYSDQTLEAKAKRAQRQSAALRANLKRRKDWAKSRAPTTDES